MSITSVYPNVTPYVGNPAVEMLKRDNARREVIVPVAQTEQQAAGQSVISEDKSRNQPNNQPLTYDVELKNRGTELRQAVDGRNPEQQQQQGQSNQQGSPDQQASQQGFGQSGQQQQQDAGQNSSAQRGLSGQELSAEELEHLDWLQSRDDEVRTHEHAHASVGGQYAGAPSYDYKRGPDGNQYAVGGEVPVDVSPVADNPAATIQKMQQVRRAALAPADPSGADRSIAAQAAMQEAQARQELAQQAIDKQTAAQTADDETEPSSTEVAAETSDAVRSNKSSGRDYRALNQDQLMQLRTSVINQFYQTSTVPADRPLRLTA